MLFALSILFCQATADVILSSPKNPSERVTSFAVDDNKLIFTYLDLDKASGPTGIVKIYQIGSGKDPVKLQLPPKAQPLITPIALEFDECNRLWILDNAVQNISGTQDKTRNPVLQAIHLKTNETVARFSFDHQYRNTKSFFATISIDIEKLCNDTWVYISDFNNAQLLVFDLQKNASWGFKHHFFHPDPMSDLPMGLIYNKHQKTVSGIYGMAVSGSRLIFHPFASKFDFQIDTHILRLNQALKYESVTVKGTRDSEAGIMRFDEFNYIYFYAGFREIGCWKNFENYTKIDVGVIDGFITDIQVIGPKLWILINYKNKYVFETRVVLELVANTPCQPTVLSHRTLAGGNSIHISALLLFTSFSFILLINQCFGKISQHF